MPNKLNLIGQKFGRLTVVSEADMYVAPSGLRQSMWNCVCECGGKKAIRGGSLTASRSPNPSCGCSPRRIRRSGTCSRGHKVAVTGVHGTNCKACYSERAWRAQKIAITWEQRSAMLAQQNGRCDICKRHELEFKRALAVDHNHATGQVRGLLCVTCNNKVVPVCESWFHLIEPTMAYLKKHSVKAVE